MMKLLLTTGLLFALLPAAMASLYCNQCFGTKEACENPMTIECAEKEDICGTVVSVITMDGADFNTNYIMSCGQSKFWKNGTYQISTIKNITITAEVQTCQSNYCNKKDFISMPRLKENKKNGRQCPVCMSMDEDHCLNNSKIFCQDDETMCMNFGVQIEATNELRLKLAILGCAKPNACNLGTGKTEVTGGLFTADIRRECWSAPKFASALEDEAVGAPQLL